VVTHTHKTVTRHRGRPRATALTQIEVALGSVEIQAVVVVKQMATLSSITKKEKDGSFCKN
jgi:hypothetical protein